MDWLKYKKIYFVFSLTLIFFGVFSLFKWGLKLGIDFKGGSLVEYKIAGTFSTEEVKEKLEVGYEISSIQATLDENYIFRLSSLEFENKENFTNDLREIVLEDVTELRFENVGPAIGPELIKKTAYAIAIASSLILIWVAYQFSNLKFGAAAVLAMFHDFFILVGLYSILGHIYNAEVDFLFATALLTTLSFSVHDTIVVFDRIREIIKKQGGEIYQVSNRALSETMVRSLNNSFTILFMLVALLLLGGSTIKWFAAALLIGTLLGTYSSPFVAVPILVTWDSVAKKIRARKKA